MTLSAIGVAGHFDTKTFWHHWWNLRTLRNRQSERHVSLFRLLYHAYCRFYSSLALMIRQNVDICEKIMKTAAVLWTSIGELWRMQFITFS